MKLKLVRVAYFDDCTIGRLYVDGLHVCDTLEDRVREVEGQPVKSWKVVGETAIPTGIYSTIVTYSPRFQCDLPLVEDVEGFTGIRLHAGNFSSDTEGCILTGWWDGFSHSITKSRAALSHLMDLIEGGICTLEVVNGGNHGERTDSANQGDGETQSV